MNPLNIAILGTPIDSGNRGVLALGASLVNLCAKVTEEGEIIFMLGNRDNHPVEFRVNGQKRMIKVVNCRLSPRSRLCEHLGWIVLVCLIYRFLPWKSLRQSIRRFTPWISALENMDIVGDIRGGDSFSDIYGLGRFFYGFFIAWTVLLVKGTMVQFPQTFGPFKSRVARWLARYLLKRSSVVIARDEKSRKVAQRLIGSGREVCLSPDVAFSLEAIIPGKIQMEPSPKGALPSGVVGLNVNGLMANGGYTRKNMFDLKMDYKNLLADLIESLLAEHPGELWLVPHTYGLPGSVESDPEACLQVRQALSKDLQERVRLVTGIYDQHEIKGIIGRFDFFIGSRMHACIAALSQGIPCVGIAYSRKFEGVFDSVGMHGWVVDGRTSSNFDAIARVLELYHQRDFVREELGRNVQDARECLHKVFQHLFAKMEQVRE